MKLFTYYLIKNVRNELMDPPVIYAITDNPEYAKLFEETRNMDFFYKKEITCTRKEGMRELDRMKAPMLTITGLKTSKDKIGSMTVNLVCTWEEERAIVLDAGSIYYQYVSDNLLNPDIYSEKVNKYLETIDYQKTWRYKIIKSDPSGLEEYMFSRDNYLLSIDVDELMLFLKSYGWTMKTNKKKG